MSAPDSTPAGTSIGIAAESLHFRYAAHLPDVLMDVTLRIPVGNITALIGPNGSGKSTLLKTLGRQLVPRSGRVTMDGRDLQTLPARELAQNVAILFQEHTIPGDTTVEELVGHGRYPYSGFLQSPTARDLEATEEALRLADLTALRHRLVSDLSGGQRQLVWVAMALAQETPYLFLDEPTTFLDLAHQFDLMDLILSLNRTLGKTIVIVLHDLNLAARYAGHLVVLQEGRIFAEGSSSDVLTVETLRTVFGVEAQIVRDETGSLHWLPTARVMNR